MKDLDDAIAFHRRALGICPLGHPYRSIWFMNLANFLCTRFWESGRIEDLEDSILSYQNALNLRPPSHQDRPMSLLNLGIALVTRYERLGRMEDLENGITSQREALGLCPPGHPEYCLLLSNLAGSLIIRYERLGAMEDLEDAIPIHRNALILCPPGHPERALSLINLANGLRSRYERLGTMKDLEDAVSFYRNALSLNPPGHPDRAVSLMNLATGLRSRYENLGAIGDLEDAISFYNDALSLFPTGHPDRSMSLMNLASALFNRYERSGRMEDLETAISFHREALSLHAPGQPGRSMSLMNLGTVLRTRYERLGRVEDLEDAISSHRSALSLRPPGNPNRALSLINLANSLFTRYKRWERMEDLEDVISFYHDALSFFPPGHPGCYMSLMNIATALLTRYQRLGSLEDLEHSISSHRKALRLRSLGNPDRPMSLMNLANVLSTRYQRSGRMEDLEDAIASHRDALSLCPPDYPNRSRSLTNLADTLWTRFQRSMKMEDCQETFLLYEQATSDVTSFAQDRLMAAVRWTNMAHKYQHTSLLLACRTSLHLLNHCLIFHPNVESQQRFLATAAVPRSLASDAASASIEGGNLELAVELLEQGRAILWSRVNAYKYPLEQLRQVEGGRQLADRLETLSAELEHLVLLSGYGTLSSGRSTSATASDAQIRKHRILSGEWEDVVATIRQIKGFGNFLQTAPFSTLQSAAAEGPVILINISRYRCDAIILLINSSPILVPLPKIQPAEQANKLRSGREIIDVLRYLWDNIVDPIVDRLAEVGIPEKSRIWWCPTSELCALPIHAAGPYRRGERNLPDLYTSSYISTLSSLIKARSNVIRSAQIPRLLVVGQPDETLQRIEDEVNIIQQLGDFADVIIGAEANSKTVLNGLKEHSWVHFACHGHLGDDAQPFRASFQLHDGRLPLLDLIRARLPNAELAFLSACYSAAGDAITPDENIHLSAALQFCGFRSIVGTLWEMNDEDGPSISKEFYKYMFRNSGKIPDFKDSAEALSSAIRAMRKNGVPVERWVMFVHIGA